MVGRIEIEADSRAFQIREQLEQRLKRSAIRARAVSFEIIHQQIEALNAELHAQASFQHQTVGGGNLVNHAMQHGEQHLRQAAQLLAQHRQLRFQGVGAENERHIPLFVGGDAIFHNWIHGEPALLRRVQQRRERFLRAAEHGGFLGSGHVQFFAEIACGNDVIIAFRPGLEFRDASGLQHALNQVDRHRRIGNRHAQRKPVRRRINRQRNRAIQRNA